MKIVIDANVLFRTLISSGSILDVIFHPSLTIYAPYQLKTEFFNHREELISKSHISFDSFRIITDEIFKKIIFVDWKKYEKYISKANVLLKDHAKDEDFIALCMLENCKLWTYEKRLISIGFGMSTRELLLYLEKK